MSSATKILRVAVPTPLRRHFDYLLPGDFQGPNPRPGVRIKVPFGRRTEIGVLLGVEGASELPLHKLKPALRVLDTEPVFDASMLKLLKWASQYYHHPIGEVFATALPAALRKDIEATTPQLTRWHLSRAAPQADSQSRAPRQAQLLRLLEQYPQGCPETCFTHLDWDWRSALQRMQKKGWLHNDSVPLIQPGRIRTPLAAPELNQEQATAVNAITSHQQSFASFLLEGVTGSGKTEVYLCSIEQVLQQQKQALVLVPEIGLTPQLVERFEARLACPIIVLHSNMTDNERLYAWFQARRDEPQVIIGTRSALFTPLPSPGLIIVDEEHDLSYKQQDGFRYSARDLAIVRARNADIPIVLGSATPALESLFNARAQRSTWLHLRQRAGTARPPVFRLIDIRGHTLSDNLSQPLLNQMHEHLNKQGQVLLFLNRRGFAPLLMCHDCGWVAKCQRCDSRMTFHQHDKRLRCHHCGSERKLDPQCPSCQSSELRQLGYGTERIEETLKDQFADRTIVRIDRDSTRRKGSMQSKLETIHAGKAEILVGTQMLAKAHHFPNVTLVGIRDVDSGFYSSDFRAPERMAQQILQVAGRAGRADRPGEVFIQTHHPDHPLLNSLIEKGYDAFAEVELEERRLTQWPPCSHLALLRAEASSLNEPMQFLQQARLLVSPPSELVLLGPLPAPMTKRAGRYRAQLVIQAADRNQLHPFLAHWLEQVDKLKSGRKVRWSLDVDPMEMY